MFSQMRGGVKVSLLVLVAGLALGCSGRQDVRFKHGAGVAGARGDVKSKIADNGNTQFNSKVEHLAAPSEVASGATTYVVWLKPLEGNQPPQNVGALQVDGDKLTGSFEGVTWLRRFEVIVTAESDTMARTPSRSQVLTAMVLQPEKG